MTNRVFNHTAPGNYRFLNPTFWNPTGVPGPADDTVLPAAADLANPYVAIVASTATVDSVSTGVGASLRIGEVQFRNVHFTMSNGTGGDQNAGEIDIKGLRSSLIFGGILNNTGTIVNNSGRIGDNSLISNDGTLTGSGQVKNFYIPGVMAHTTLENFDNIIEESNITNLSLSNEKAGVLFSDSFSFDSVINRGVIELARIADSTVDSSDGRVLIYMGFSLDVFGSTLIGGTLRGIGGGSIAAQMGGGNRPTLLDGTNSSVVNEGLVTVPNTIILDIQGTIANAGTIALGSTGGSTRLVVTAKSASLTGAGGLVAMSGNPNNRIAGTLSGGVGTWSVSTLTNAGTITGAGNIGLNLALVNSGLIEATGPGAGKGANAGVLVLATGYAGARGSNTIVNSGVLEGGTLNGSAPSGGLLLQGVTVSQTPDAGTIEAVGGGSHVDLKSAVILGGVLTTAGGGVIQALDGGSLLSGTARRVINQGDVRVADGAALGVQGVIDNVGTISLAAVKSTASLIVGIGATLTGAGQVSLADNAGAAIVGSTATGAKGATPSLTNVNDTIFGAGQIGDARMSLINQAAGVIDASGTHVLVLDTGANTIVNAGLIEVTGTGGLIIRSAVSGPGSARIAAGALQALGAFGQDVAFTGQTGVLELARSQAYGGTVSGLSPGGGTSLDLDDIGFVGPGEASYSGTTSGGVLTVTDGTHTAHITLAGDYTTAAFVAASDGHGGTTITDPAAGQTARLAAAIAALGPTAGAHRETWAPAAHAGLRHTLLARR